MYSRALRHTAQRRAVRSSIVLDLVAGHRHDPRVIFGKLKMLVSTTSEAGRSACAAAVPVAAGGPADEGDVVACGSGLPNEVTTEECAGS